MYEIHVYFIKIILNKGHPFTWELPLDHKIQCHWWEMSDVSNLGQGSRTLESIPIFVFSSCHYVYHLPKSWYTCMHVFHNLQSQKILANTHWRLFFLSDSSVETSIFSQAKSQHVTHHIHYLSTCPRYLYFIIN